MLFSLQLSSAFNARSYDQGIIRHGALGYDAVEGFFDIFDDASAIRTALDKAGMTMPTIHVPLVMLEGDVNGVARLCETLGTKTVYTSWLEEKGRPGDPSGWLALAKRLAVIHKNMAVNGLNFGWHNHDFEFFPMMGGKTGMEILLQDAPDIEWAADIAWITRGKADPLAWIFRYKNRITAAHFKDIAPKGEKTDEDGWADPGTGIIDWKTALFVLKNKTPVSVLVAGHDKPADFYRFASKAVESYRGLESDDQTSASNPASCGNAAS